MNGDPPPESPQPEASPSPDAAGVRAVPADPARAPRPAITFELVSLFPEIFASVLATSLLGRAVERGIVAVHHTSPRDFGIGRHRSVDDTPYGGGSGMVMRAEPIAAALDHVESTRGPAWKVLLDPHGARLDQAKVRELAARPRVALVCGRYEGFDERVRPLCDENLSLGDFVLSGGELAAMTIVDAVARLHEGVLGNAHSVVEESFESGLLEYPHYTRPVEFRGQTVPPVLSSGDHEKVRRWRRQSALLRTRERRPDLFARHTLSDEDRRLLADAGVREPAPGEIAARTHVALLHHPVVDRGGAVITTAITNLDVHDLARSSRTYGLSAFHVVTPVAAQRDLAAGLIAAWLRDDTPNADRTRAIARVIVQPDLDATIAAITARHRAAPLVVGTSARAMPPTGTTSSGAAVVSPEALLARAAADARPVLILLGTGWGLAKSAMDRVDLLLPAIQATSAYNHLSVRSAGAILLDRLFGDRR